MSDATDLDPDQVNTIGEYIDKHGVDAAKDAARLLGLMAPEVRWEGGESPPTNVAWSHGRRSIAALWADSVYIYEKDVKKSSAPNRNSARGRSFRGR